MVSRVKIKKGQIEDYISDSTTTYLGDVLNGNISVDGYNKVDWDLASSWGDHREAGYLTDVTVQDINSNPNKHDISIVQGKVIKETVTQLNQPYLDGNNLVIKFLNENNVEQTVSVDLSNIATNNNGINNATYNASTNVITLTEDDGDVWEIDLSEFSIITNTDANGITTLAQENTVKLTISKVGQTGDYNDLLNLPEPFSGIDIQDPDGNTLFNVTDYLKIEGLTVDIAEKKIKSSPRTPYTIYVDNISGDDSTGELTNIDRPFKTIDEAIANIPDSNEMWTIQLLKNGVHDINNILPNSYFRIHSLTSSTVTFENNLNTGNLISGILTKQIIFDLPYGTLKLNSPGDGSKNSTYFTCQFGHITIKANILEISNTFRFNRIDTLNIDVKTMNLSGEAFYWIWGDGKSTCVIDQLNCVGNSELFTYGINTPVDMEISVSSINCDGTFYLHPAPSDGRLLVRMGDFTTTHTGAFNFMHGNTDKVIYDFQNSTLSGEIKFYNGLTMKGDWTLENNSQIYLFPSQAKKYRMVNGTFTYKGTGNLLNGRPNGTLSLDNYNIIMENDGYIAYVSGPTFDYTNAAPIIETFGTSSVKFNTNDKPLVRAATSITEGMKMVINGDFQTNGIFESAVSTKGLVIEKPIHGVLEKRKEIVVRSKGQLIAEELKSDINYIIDGDIALSAGEHIYVPEGGLTLTGYSFDASRLGSYGVDYHSIFRSPEQTNFTDKHTTLAHGENEGGSYGHAGPNEDSMAMYYDKSGDRTRLGVDISDPSLDYLFCESGNGTSWSIGCWFKPEAKQAGSSLIMGYGYQWYDCNLWIQLNSKTELEIITRGTSTKLSGILSPNTWYYIEVKWDGANLKAYFQGVETSLTIGTKAKRTAEGNYAYLGEMSGSNPYAGYISNAFIYNRNRTTQESDTSYNSGVGITYSSEPTTGLLAYYGCDDQPGGSGNLVIHNIGFTTTGDKARVFDIHDIDGNHALEMITVNFEGCKEIGSIKNYRQGTGITIGFYGCGDGLTFSGQWNGFKLTNTNAFSFGAEGTMFKAGPNLTFDNRFYLEINVDLPSTAKITDFSPENFNNNELLQINTTLAKVDGVIDPKVNTPILFPNITTTDPQALFVDNIGLVNSPIHPYGIELIELQIHNNDTDALTAGLNNGDAYVNGVTGTVKRIGVGEVSNNGGSNFDNYDHWDLTINGADGLPINSGEAVNFVSGENITITRENNDIIFSADNNYIKGVTGDGNSNLTIEREGLSNITHDLSHNHDGVYATESRVDAIEEDKNYTYVQSTPSTQWVVVHNMNKYPNVAVFDDNNNTVWTEVVYTNLNTITINFNSAMSGTVTLN